MKFSLSWLRRHLEFENNIDEIIDALTNIGLEVEEVENNFNFDDFTIGKIIAYEKHPDADKLGVCKVETGDGVQQIVCGAPNAREGIFVAYAKIGTYLPKIDLKIKVTKIRGVDSHGMLCSKFELGLGNDHDGILEIAGDPIIGEKLSKYFKSDPIINIEVTPNRPDTNGVDAIARDLYAYGIGKLIEPKNNIVNSDIDEIVKLSNIEECKENNPCPAFGTRIIRNVKNGPSPKWLVDLLENIGQKSINILVDITNYFSIDQARPMHVYDLDKISDLTLRYANDGEEFQALNNKKYNLCKDDFVISDEKAIHGLVGVIGGEKSQCDEKSTNILLEAAYFLPSKILETGQRNNITTDARYRFERGVDRNNIHSSLENASALIKELAGGDFAPISICGKEKEENTIINFNFDLTKKISGMDIPQEKQIEILENLGFEIKKLQEDGIANIIVPTKRPDCNLPIDLVEEITRIYGFDKIKAEKIIFNKTKSDHIDDKKIENYNFETKARFVLANKGYLEVINFAFCDSNYAEYFEDNLCKDLYLKNPIASNMDILKPNLFLGLVENLKYNIDRKNKGLKIFEIAPIYKSADEEGQIQKLAAAIHVTKPIDWQKEKNSYDLFSAKKEIIDALADLNIETDKFIFENFSDEKYLHPAKAARLVRYMGKKEAVIAHFGLLHPMVAKKYDIDENIILWQINLENLPIKTSKKLQFKPLKEYPFPSVERDFSFLIKREISVSDVIETLKKGKIEFLTDFKIFDYYLDKNDQDNYSLAFRITLLRSDRTFTKEEINKISHDVINLLSDKLGALLKYNIEDV